MSQKEIDKQPIRLLVIVNVFNPDRGGGGAIFSDLCYGLAEREYDVTVRCAYPYYPEWKDKSGKNGLTIQRYDEKGVHVERYGIFIPRNPRSLFQRLIYEASFFLSLLRSLARGRGFDLVMVYCPLVGAVGFADLNRCIYRKPLWLNVQDLSADAAAASGIARSSFIKRCLSVVQGLLFNRADIWSSISPVMIERLQAIRRRNQPVYYLPNWLNESMAVEIGKLPSKQFLLGHTHVRLLYAGNIGGKQDLLRFCQSLHKSDAPFTFHIFANGTEANIVENWINTANDSRFQFGAFLDEQAFAVALNDADLFIITEKTGGGGSFIPCKLIAGVSSGTPILAVSDADSPLAREMHEHALGSWFSWNELDQVPKLLQRIIDDPSILNIWHKNVLNRSVFYQRNHTIDEFDVVIKTIVRKKTCLVEKSF